MVQKVKAYVEQHHMLEQQDCIITGVSGGADSVCLLFILLRLKDIYGFELKAVHVHHGLRGDSADADEEYVRSICEEWKVPLRVYHEDVRAYAAERGMTEEEAGRVVRRDIFRKEKEAWEQNLPEGTRVKIALAHHMNDNAETILFHLCRGTGPRGLGGIAPVSGDWIRPLLGLKRSEIEAFLNQEGIAFCTDETNQENTYSRNKIRNQVYPYLEAINPRVTEHISRTAKQIRELWEYMDQEVIRWAAGCVRQEESGEVWILNLDAYAEVPEVLKSYVVHRAICEAAGQAKDIASIHVEQLQGLMKRQVGRSIRLPYGVLASRCYEGVRLERCVKAAENAAGDREKDIREYDILAGEELPEGFRFRILEREPGAVAFPEKLYTKWFDYDIIKNTVKIRHREPGDSIVIDQKGRTQKIKKYFINEKIPEQERDLIWLIAEDDQVLWVVGYRQSQKYQITKETKRILEIQFYGGNEHGRDSQSNDRRGESCGKN